MFNINDNFMYCYREKKIHYIIDIKYSLILSIINLYLY